MLFQKSSCLLPDLHQLIGKGPERLIKDEIMLMFIVDANTAAMNFLDVSKKTALVFDLDFTFRVIF